LLSDEILLAVRECEREGMGITNGNGNKTRLNLGLGMLMNHWKWDGMGLKKAFPLISSLIIVTLNRLFTVAGPRVEHVASFVTFSV